MCSLLSVQLIEGVGLASVACYLSMYLDVPLPRNMVFLGEVRYQGEIYHPVPMNEHYLDFCLREGFSRIVGPSSRLQVLRDVVTKDRYEGIELIELTNVKDIVPKVFRLLREAVGHAGDDGPVVH